jgi:proline dehydrogenase
MERAKREGYHFAAKTVRGAYMVAERARAKAMEYDDPIAPTIDATHANYNQVMDDVCLLEHNMYMHAWGRW